MKFRMSTKSKRLLKPDDEDEDTSPETSNSSRGASNNQDSWHQNAGFSPKRAGGKPRFGGLNKQLSYNMAAHSLLEQSEDGGGSSRVLLDMEDDAHELLVKPKNRRLGGFAKQLSFSSKKSSLFHHHHHHSSSSDDHHDGDDGDALLQKNKRGGGLMRAASFRPQGMSARRASLNSNTKTNNIDNHIGDIKKPELSPKKDSKENSKQLRRPSGRMGGMSKALSFSVRAGARRSVLAVDTDDEGDDPHHNGDNSTDGTPSIRSARSNVDRSNDIAESTAASLVDPHSIALTMSPTRRPKPRFGFDERDLLVPTTPVRNGSSDSSEGAKTKAKKKKKPAQEAESINNNNNDERDDHHKQQRPTRPAAAAAARRTNGKGSSSAGGGAAGDNRPRRKKPASRGAGGGNDNGGTTKWVPSASGQTSHIELDFTKMPAAISQQG